MLYPPITPYESGWLEVGQGHRVYWEQCGNPQGQPALFLHGGPGGGCSDKSRRLFDPQRYRIVLLDQRGCGRSTPHASIAANDTAHLVQDMELLRQHLKIEQWVLCGGSWGCVLALAYTQLHRERVQGLVLRGVFTGQPHEFDWLYRSGGASQVFPQAWAAFASALGNPLSTAEAQSKPYALFQTYVDELLSDNPVHQLRAALAWCQWESAISSLYADAPATATDPRHSLAMARISAHIFVNDTWLGRANRLWPVHYLAGLPGIIVQGRFDMVTPAVTAEQLRQAWVGSELRMVSEAGHTSNDPALQQALVRALDDMAGKIRH
jgi:proline iminopeptidase